MWSNCLFVALGGGLGAVGRYLLSLIAAPWSFPVMTLLTNFPVSYTHLTLPTIA